MTDETEIKLRVGNLDAARELLESHGFSVAVPMVFESNVVLDNAVGELRESRRLLRLREAGDVVTVTYKGVATIGKHKQREERETRVESFGEMLKIFERLGYRQTFRYEKYRTEYRGSGSGIVVLDETPVGNFLEIEGPPEWIDQTAHLLGFHETDYQTSSYGSLYSAWCREQGISPTNMIFANRRASVL